MNAVATDAELEALLDGEAPEPGHAVCAYCFPIEVFGLVEVVAICGHVYRVGSALETDGLHKCARCLALVKSSRLPCGHP